MSKKIRTTTQTIRYFAKNIFVVVGLVIIWRGIWYVMDEFDTLLFSGEHIYTAIGGIIVGLAILYIPDKDLKEIEKL
jgi:hypothetical protein